MVNKEKLSKMTLSELLTYKETVDVLHNYYDNLAKSTMGDYNDYMKNEYDMAIKEVNKYKDISYAIFEIMKERVEDVL